ncbi:MAG: pantoate--beta-alanine ligase [Patescibacteria group bacterium]|jgi:pantoate--beta-alanine ligase
MILFKKEKDLKAFFKRKKSEEPNCTFGFVPTMGALHHGHLSLIKRSLSENSDTVCSIFVNPTQFNEKTDLDKYPRTIENDMALLEAAGNSILFWPVASEVYPPGLKTKLSISFEGLENVMEGYFRPGHFDGMAQVVKRLLDMVEPDRLYMGQKDFQQVAIVRNMIEQLSIPIELVMCPIIREKDGLAMSSRNVRLPKKHRIQVPVLHKTLKAVARKIKKQKDIQTLKEWATKQLSLPDIKLEYFEIADGRTLQSILAVNESDYIVACLAVWIGEVRLIDNMVLVEAKN